MKCPYCSKETKARVLESRKLEGQVWRERLCGSCHKTFVSHETTSREMKFPWSKLNKRVRQEKKAPAPTFVPPHLWARPGQTGPSSTTDTTGDGSSTAPAAAAKSNKPPK